MDHFAIGRECSMDVRTFVERFVRLGFDAKSFEVQRQSYAQISPQIEPQVQKIIDEEINLFIQVATIMPGILGDDKLYNYLDMITNNFVAENMESFLHYPYFDFIDYIKATIAKRAQITQLFLPYIRDKDIKYTRYEREIDILAALFSEVINTNEQTIFIIELYFILIHIIEQFATTWINMYPQFGDITYKADALHTYARLYCEGDRNFTKGLCQNNFAFSCWLFCKNIDDRSLRDIVQSINTETGQAIEQIKTSKIREKLLQSKNDVTMQRPPVGDLKEAITISVVDKYSGTEFEAFVGTLFEADGYQVEFTQASNDKGIDIIAKRNGISIGIQCKRYSSNIGISAVQEVFSGKNFYSLDKALVVTNRSFTKAAKDLADSTGVVLWDRTILDAKIKLVY